jgi:hypothetical protein
MLASRATVVAMIVLAGCATPTRLYMPTVADKPRGDAGYQADLAACKAYEAQTRMGVGLAGATFGIAGAAAVQSASGNGLFDTPNDVVDSCMVQHGYRVLSNGGRY